MLSKAQRLSSEEQMESLLAASGTAPTLIFKHSATCGISRRAIAEFQQFLDGEHDTNFTAAYLIVQEDRPIANALAERLNVKHETPQAILLRDGAARWHASHGKVTASALTAALADALEA